MRKSSIKNTKTNNAKMIPNNKKIRTPMKAEVNKKKNFTNKNLNGNKWKIRYNIPQIEYSVTVKLVCKTNLLVKNKSSVWANILYS